jgi:uncharacterized protein YbjQ (UPF0145 family)
MAELHPPPDTQIPDNARHRLEQMRSTPGELPGFFTSDLSVNEYYLLEQAGFEPLGFVMGSSFYHIGIQWTIMPYQNYELDVLTQALYHARENAMARMEEEAAVLDADGIVGVRLEFGQHAWAAGMAEFTAMGTAVRALDRSRNFRKNNGRPFTSDLSGQEFWTLLRTQCRPLELAMGNCVYHVGKRGFRQSLQQYGRNIEMPNYTQALYNARELALDRLQAEGHRVGANGIVGVSVKQSNYGWGSHVLEFFALGTAVHREGAVPKAPEPSFVLTLNDPPRPSPQPVRPPMPTPSGYAGGGGE